MKVLVAEDEPKVLRFLKEALEDAGMIVDGVSSVDDVLSAVEASSYDCLILDRLLGKYDIIDVIPKIRSHRPFVGILVLSALSESSQKVDGLRQGADDYLGKPFHLPELIARIRALTRRDRAREELKSDVFMTFGELTIDLERQRVLRNGKRIALTKKEFQVLTLLARRPGVVFSKMHLLEQAWDLNHHPESNVVEVVIASLRAKIDRGHKALIHSQRGAGYWFGEDE